MGGLRAVWIVSLMLSFAALTACDGYSSYEDGLYAANGESCTGDSRCESGLCVEGTCRPSCVDDDECKDDKRCKLRAGADYGRCVEPCTSDPGDGVLCVDGLPTECSELDDTFCEACGCPGDRYCLTEPNRCVARVGTGQACAHDGECSSGNCSAFAGVCRVRVGADCTADNCDRCLSTADGSYCTRDCGDATVRWGETDLDAPECGGTGTCETLSTEAGKVRECVPSCSECPGMCEDDVCNCDDCEVSSPDAELGERCARDADCASALCLVRARDCEEDGDTTRCLQQGLCAQTCAEDADCEAGSRCTADGVCLPECNAGEVVPEALRSDESCTGGVCVPVATAGDESVMLCEPRGMNGAACAEDSQCAGGSCVEGTCAFAASAP